MFEVMDVVDDIFQWLHWLNFNFKKIHEERFSYEYNLEIYQMVEDLIDILDIDEEIQLFVEDIYYWKNDSWKLLLNCRIY